MKPKYKCGEEVYVLACSEEGVKNICLGTVEKIVISKHRVEYKILVTDNVCMVPAVGYTALEKDMYKTLAEVKKAARDIFNRQIKDFGIKDAESKKQKKQDIKERAEEVIAEKRSCPNCKHFLANELHGVSFPNGGRCLHPKAGGLRLTYAVKNCALFDKK